MAKALLVIVTVLVAAAAAVYFTRLPKPSAPAAPGGATPAPLVLDAAANAGFLDQYRGQVVLLDFWAVWCPPCRAAMPGVQALHEKYQGKPVVVLGANTWEKPSNDPRAFMKDNGYTYGLVLNADELARKFSVRAIPTFVVLDADGNPIYRGEGGGRDHEIAAAIDGYLASKGL